MEQLIERQGTHELCEVPVPKAVRGNDDKLKGLIADRKDQRDALIEKRSQLSKRILDLNDLIGSLEKDLEA